MGVEGAVVKVRVSTGAGSFAVEGFDEWTGELRVRLKSEPVKGRANKELLGELSRLFGTKVELVLGEKSSRKKLFVHGRTLLEAERQVLSWRGL
jgi:hypothetical protein